MLYGEVIGIGPSGPVDRCDFPDVLPFISHTVQKKNLCDEVTMKEWTLESPVVTICTTRFNIHKFYVLPTQFIYVFCVDLRTNSDYFPIQHELTGFYNRDEVCLLRGTDWVLIYNSTFCPHSVFMCFVWIWEQTAIISLYSINWLVFITETECAYCAVRTGSLYTIQVNISV